MSLRSLKLLPVLSAVLMTLGCSGTGGSEDGFIALDIENSRAPEGYSALTISDLPSPRLVVTKFRVTVSGEGIDPILTSDADASATEIEVLGIPPGPNRSILIEAFNSDGEVIRRRRIDGVTISPGVVTPIKTSLNTIPLILNLRNGNIVDARNLRISGFGEPGSTIEITSQTKDGPLSFSESVGGSPPVISPSLSTGLFELSPSQRPVGRQTITVTDTGSEESSSVSVLVIEGEPPGRRLSPVGGLYPTVSMGPGIGGSRAVQFPVILYNLGGQK